MGNVLHKSFKAAVKKLKNELPILVESGSEVSHLISKPSNFAEVTRLPSEFKKAWLKATLKEIKNLINNKKFIMDYPEKGYPVTPCTDVYKAKIQSDGSLEMLKLRILVIGDFQNKEMIGYT